MSAQIVPLDREFDRAFAPFAEAAATRKCYIREPGGPPTVLKEVPCGDIVIIGSNLNLEAQVAKG